MTSSLIVLAFVALAAMGGMPMTGLAENNDKDPPKTFSFATYDRVTIRQNPTTQVAIRIAQWPGQTFLLWLPEAVGDLWQQWDPAVAHQDFARTDRGGLRWEFAGNPMARLVAELVPRESSLLLEVRIKNVSDRGLTNVVAQNCIHLSQAPDFACDDFSRLYLRVKGQWHSIKDLGVTDSFPMFYRPGFLESGRRDSWGGIFQEHNQEERADHPMMICTSKDGKRTIGTVSEDFQCVFHNHGLKYLLCPHSQQAPIPLLAPGRQAVFRQVIYFVEGGLEACLRAYDEDVKSGFLKP